MATSELPDGAAVSQTPKPKLFIRTFGCQMNEYDSAKMADVLAASDGYTRTDQPEEADLLLLNTLASIIFFHHIILVFKHIFFNHTGAPHQHFLILTTRIKAAETRLPMFVLFAYA